MNGKKWIVLDAIVGVIAGTAGLLGIFTTIKAEKANEEERMAELEARYGLTPVNNEEEEA